LADLRQLALSAPHARSRERWLALHEIAQGGCATRVAECTGRLPQIVMDWLYTYNEHGPEALIYRHTGARPRFCPEIEAALDETIRAAQQEAAKPPVAGADPPPRWTLKRLVAFVQELFGRRYCRETIRAALRRLDLSWKKARKLLGRADAGRRETFVKQIGALLDGARDEQHALVYLDEAHIHQDVDLGYGWAERGQRFHVASSSPGLSAKSRSMACTSATKARCGSGPIGVATAKTPSTLLRRLRAAIPEGKLIVIWDGAPYHRAKTVWAAAASLDIHIEPLPGYTPDLMPVERLWRWLREDVTYNHCHATAEDLVRRVAAFETTINQNVCAVADRLWVKDHLDPEEEKLWFSK
jgi:transposase